MGSVHMWKTFPKHLWAIQLLRSTFHHFLNQYSYQLRETEEHRAGNLLIGFLSEAFVFCKKWANERFAQRNARFAHGRSFLVSDLSDSLMIANFWWATWGNHLWTLIFGEWPEQIAHIAHFWWATWAICSHRSEEMSYRERIAHIVHQKRGNEQKKRFAHFSIKFVLKIVYKTY